MAVQEPLKTYAKKIKSKKGFIEISGKEANPNA